jgi:hypothetical protein
MANQSAINLFTSVVHSAEPSTATAINLFSSVVHDSAPPTATAINLYTSVVHNSTPPTATAINLFSSVVHTSASLAIADITGTVGVSASFDASGFGDDSYKYRWSWQTVPSGSSLVNAPIALPDGGGDGYFNMTDNVGLWHFDGDADDTSGINNNGTIFGSPAVVTGNINQAYQFDGASDYIEVANDSSLNSNFGTISVWIKFTSSGLNQTIVAKNDPTSSNNGWHLYIEGATDELRAQIKGSGTTTLSPSTGPLNDDNWHHIVLVFRASEETKLFLDGTEVANTLSTTNFTVSSQPLRIARNVDSFWDLFAGAIDEFALWGRELSTQEVQDLYFLQSGNIATDLVGNEGVDEIFTFVPDVSGTYTVDFDLVGPSSGSASADAVISAAGPTPPTPGPIITGSSPTVNLVESKQSLRLRTNTEFTGSS